MPPDPDELELDAEAFGRVLDVGKRLRADDFERSGPPDALWDRIAAGLRTDDQPRGLTVVVDGGNEQRTSVGAPGGTAPSAPVGHRNAPPRSWFRPWAVAAALVLAAGTVGVIALSGGDDRQELAAVSLDVLKEGSGSAEVKLVDVDGSERLVVSLADLPPTPDGHHYELWLIDLDVTDPVSLGEVPPGSETIEVTVPAGVNPDEYPVVDINLQEDGVAEHSGPETSVLRGVLA